jgi:predicted ATPase
MSLSRHYVVTGGPSVGKTTLINALRTRGLRVRPEAARQIIFEGVFHPLKDRVTFQSAVLARQLEDFSLVSASEGVTFHDRGVFDGEAYCRLSDMPVPDELLRFDPRHYSLAFLLEPLPFFSEDGVRTEDAAFTGAITPLLEQAYAHRAVRVVRVPAYSVERRVDLVLTAVRRLSH